MQITISGRHLEITEDIRSYVEKRAKKVESIFNRVVDLQVVLELEKSRYLTEITLATRKATFHAQGETHDVFTSLDRVMDKIENQIRRHKERIRDWRHRPSQRDVASQLVEGEAGAASEGTTVSDAPLSFVRVPEKFAPKPRTVEEAAMQLRTAGDSFLLFLNAATNQINLEYEEDRGEYGWVEPQFV
jgi:putative sigma-54 modulation protein